MRARLTSRNVNISLLAATGAGLLLFAGLGGGGSAHAAASDLPRRLIVFELASDSATTPLPIGTAPASSPTPSATATPTRTAVPTATVYVPPYMPPASPPYMPPGYPYY